MKSKRPIDGPAASHPAGRATNGWRLGIGASLIGVCTTLVLIFWLGGLPARQRAASASVVHSLDVLQMTSTLDIALQTTVSEARGLVTSGTAQDLGRLDDAVLKLTAATGALRAITADSPTQQEALDRLEPLVAARVGVLRQAIAFSVANDEPGLLQLTQSGVGSTLMEQCNAVIGGIKTEEEGLLRKRQKVMGRAATLFVIGMLVCIVLIAVSAAAVTLLLVRLRIERRSMERLRRLNRALEDRVNERTMALAASHARQQGYFMNAPIGIVVMQVGEDGQFLLEDVNPAARSIFDFPAGSVPGRTLRELWPELVAADKQEKMQACAFSRLPMEYSVSRQIRGTTHVLDIMLAPILDAAGKTSVVLLCAHDVTKQRELERQAIVYAERQAEAAEREIAMFRNSPDALTVIRVEEHAGGANFIYEEFSPAHEDVTGLRPDTMVGRRPQDCLTPALAEDVLSRYRECLEMRSTIKYAATYVLPIGTRQCEGSLTPVPHPATGRIVRLVGIMRDVTERNRLEEVLRHSQKMEAIGRLSAGVAHDFNNILQSIVGCLEFVLDGVVDDASKEFGNAAINAAMRGASLTHHLLSYARKQMLRPQIVALAPIMTDLQNLLGRTLNPNITLSVRVDQMPSMFVDPGQLQTALLNLAINASHAMPNGGRLNMEVRVSRGDEHPWVSVVVTDTGVGMDAATLAQAVDPFFTTKGTGGSGLGLSMVQGFVEQSGGEFKISSVLGEGTSVELRIPFAASADQPDGPLLPKLPTTRCRVLLVDDTADVLISTGASLRRAGFTVVDVESGARALDLFDAGERFDVLVSDYAMPGMNGADLIASARLCQPGLPALIISGFSAASSAEVLNGSTLLLQKPFRLEELIEMLRRITGGESALAQQPSV
jgi:PAS domain S-box-containing protein